MDTDENFFEALFEHVAKQLLLGKPPGAITHDLVNLGVSQDVATQVVQEIAVRLKREKRKSAGKTIVIGLAMAVLGVVITAWTYAVAKPGEYFIVTYGLVIVGLLNMARGLWRLFTA